MEYSKQKFVDYFDSGNHCVKLAYRERIGSISYSRHVKANIVNLHDTDITVIIDKLLHGENEGVDVGKNVQIPYDSIESHEFCAKGHRNNN